MSETWYTDSARCAIRIQHHNDGRWPWRASSNDMVIADILTGLRFRATKQEAQDDLDALAAELDWEVFTKGTHKGVKK